jgi:hypothetical protein
MELYNRYTSFSPRLVALLIAGLTSGCVFFGGPAPAPLPEPDLAGTWIYNAAQSTDSAALAAALADTLRDWRYGGMGSLGGNGTGVYGPASDDTIGVNRMPRRWSRDATASLRAAAASAEQFKITRAGDTISFTIDDRTFPLPTDGSGVDVRWLNGEMSNVRAKWRDGRLELERQLAGGIRITEYYSRGPGSSVMVVYSILDGPWPREVSLRRVYDFGG